MPDLDGQERSAPRSVSADLPFDEVARLVSFLPAARLRELAKGPLPELKPGDEGYATSNTCRVCVALDPMTSSGPAKALLAWHDFVTESFELVGAMVRDDEEPETVAQVQAFIGACSYARCCTLYALARAALREERSKRLIGLAEHLASEHDLFNRASDLLSAVKTICDEPLDERAGKGPTRTEQFAKIDALLKDLPTLPGVPVDTTEWARKHLEALGWEAREDTERPDAKVLRGLLDLIDRDSVEARGWSTDAIDSAEALMRDIERPSGERNRLVVRRTDDDLQVTVRDTERPDVVGHVCVEYRTVVKHGAHAEPWIESQSSGAQAEEWLASERQEHGRSIEYARVEWRMVSRWITPPDQRFFARRSEANTPRSEMEPNRRKLYDRRGVVRDTEQERKR